MVVNINPCASIYDETLQALKFSALASQVKTLLNILTSVNFRDRFNFACHNSTKNKHYVIPSFQLVHGPSTKTRVAYILSLLHEPAADGNESSVMEDEEESDVEDGDISMLNTEVTAFALIFNI